MLGQDEYNEGDVFGRKLYQTTNDEWVISSARAQGTEIKVLRIAHDDFRLIMASQGSHFHGTDDLINAELPSEFENRVPFRLEDFEVLDLVGYGSFGKVSLVRESKTKQIFALKEVSKRKVISTGQIGHIINEKRVMSVLDSPFCVKLFSLFFACLFILAPSLGLKFLYMLENYIRHL
ncbi:serine/threonine protein kinase (YPK1) [Reticulomyxa filosa]|uniref:Serine/threonine protein kinase (YPK1) n=1 Tax=Reticulomyxa filosa TaxID=46433 RepID=X6MQ83_RETFI|nr:serine/threonine protein kinase (YPK1) [Reticulomyxa filosa]|eukprot:ETO16163.1 serine/threonine protein kinase (YPK1) [Reticulomyxa filosa]